MIDNYIIDHKNLTICKENKEYHISFDEKKIFSSKCKKKIIILFEKLKEKEFLFYCLQNGFK